MCGEGGGGDQYNYVCANFHSWKLQESPIETSLLGQETIS